MGMRFVFRLARRLVCLILLAGCVLLIVRLAGYLSGTTPEGVLADLDVFYAEKIQPVMSYVQELFTRAAEKTWTGF